MLNVLAVSLIFAGWFLERRARKRAEMEFRLMKADRDRMDFIGRTFGDRVEQQAELLVQRDAAIAALKKQNLALADRVAQQSQLLVRAAEQKADSERRLGYLFPRGLETPPSREDALSPTWCREGADAQPR